MKRILSILCVLSLIFVITGCGDNKKTEEKTEDNDDSYYVAADYLKDSSLFKPVWSDRKKVSDKMLDFEEKWQQFFTPDGRLMSSAHRGDNVNYPENSTEAYLSAIMMGADIIEVDVGITKDNIPIVMHDETLERVTNLLKLRKQNVSGLPTSNSVKDWTLAQIRRLRLLSPDGSKVTNYVVPTLEDVITIANGRSFITLDKFDIFDWYQDIMPLLEKHNAYRTVMMPYNYTQMYSYDRVEKMMNEIQDLSGYQSPLMSRVYDSTNVERVSKLVDKYNFPKVLRCGEYDYDDYEAYEPYVNKYRIHVECLKKINDSQESWERIVSQGYKIIVTNDIEGLTEYIQKESF